MKKLISILLLIMMMLTFSACEENKMESEEAKTSSTKADTTETENTDSSVFNKANYTIEQGDPYTYPDGAYSVRTTYKLKEKKERSFPVEITLDSEKITLNSTKIGELTNTGWVLINGNKTDSAVKPHLIMDAVINSPNEKKALVYAANTTDNTINFADCPICEIKIRYDDRAVYYDGLTEAAEFNYSDSITFSSSLSKIIDKLGEPDRITIDDYFEEERLQKSTISVSYTDERSNTVVEFEFKNEGNSSKMIAATFNYPQ